MTGSLAILAATLGAAHAALGADHTVPFAALARAGNWSLRRTLAVTVLAGLGHVAASLAIGAAGLGLLSTGAPSNLLIAFGLLYAAWGLRHKPSPAVSTGVLVAILALGPCEPLVPLMLAAASHGAVPLVVCLFTLTTVGTMTAIVLGLRRVAPSGRYAHALAGMAMAASGLLA